MDCAAHLNALGFEVQALEVGLRREPLSRLLVAEGRTLLRYVLGREPGFGLVRRYVRSLAAIGQYGPLPAGSYEFPTLVRFAEPFGPTSPLGRRLAFAAALAEA